MVLGVRRRITGVDIKDKELFKFALSLLNSFLLVRDKDSLLAREGLANIADIVLTFSHVSIEVRLLLTVDPCFLQHTEACQFLKGLGNLVFGLQA